MDPQAPAVGSSTLPLQSLSSPAAAPGDASWRLLFRVGAVAALVGVAGSAFDIGLTMVPGWGESSVPTNPSAWLSQAATQPLLALRNLDLLNVTLSFLALPLYLALFGAHRRAAPAVPLLALLLVAAGTTLFAASNAALPMVDLARRSAALPAGPERAAAEAAALALLVRGAHGSAGAFPGFFLSEAGTLLMAVGMLGGGVFGRRTAWLGLAGSAALMTYTLLVTFFPALLSIATAIAAPGGLMMMAWEVLVARHLFRLAAARSA
jgi:hypothetical protein